jgi:carbamoyl-phosphate synthase small subunit
LPVRKKAKLILEDGAVFTGEIFGAQKSVAGEVVFNTGMVGYPESLTDPSYSGQILVFTQPMIGNYGVPEPKTDKYGLPCGFESDRIHVLGVVIGDLSEHFEHHAHTRTFEQWLASEGIPGVTGIDTRALTKRLREKGTMLGKLEVGRRTVSFWDPNKANLVHRVSQREISTYGKSRKKVVLLDCGVKLSIIRSLLARGIEVTQVPWDYDFLPMLTDSHSALVLSNGPGDPKMVPEAVKNVRRAFRLGKPIMGICLGNQIMALAAGFDTFKLKYGHRSQNQPAIEHPDRRCYITSQNHGYAVRKGSGPSTWRVWFENANDGTVEGISHRSKPFFAVQFHPEAAPGPTDTGFLFDRLVEML